MDGQTDSQGIQYRAYRQTVELGIVLLAQPGTGATLRFFPLAAMFHSSGTQSIWAMVQARFLIGEGRIRCQYRRRYWPQQT